MDQESLRTGEVAAQAGVNVETLRYYERRGLLKAPPRRRSGYREYGADSVRVVRFIKRAQQLGFTLHEIQELLRLRTDRRVSCEKVLAVANAKMADIADKIRSLQAMKRALGVLAESCASTDGASRECPLLEALDERGGRSPRSARGSR